MNLGRRRGDRVGYQRGSGSVEVELANLQSAVERIEPRHGWFIERQLTHSKPPETTFAGCFG